MANVCRTPVATSYEIAWSLPARPPRIPLLHSLAINGAGHLLVTDRAQHRILKYTTGGTDLGEWGGRGRCGHAGEPDCSDPQFDGMFFDPTGIAFDGAGNLVVADSGNGRIQVLDGAGGYLAQWGTEGSAQGQLRAPDGLAIDGGGAIFVADSGNNRVQKFSAGGAFIAAIGESGPAEARLVDPAGVAVGAGGKVFVTEVAGFVKIYTPAAANPDQYEHTATLNGPGSGQGLFRNPAGIAVDAAHVYIADTGNTRLLKLRQSDGVLVTAWGTAGNGDDQFLAPRGIAVAASTVAVVDAETTRVQGFRGNGSGYTQLWSFTLAPHGPNGCWEPHGIADHLQGMAVADTRNHRIQMRMSDGTFLREWGGYGSQAGAFKFPTGVASDASGHLYVADRDNHRVQKLSAEGAPLAQWGAQGSGTEELDAPRGIAVDAASGAIYVADTGNNRIQKLTAGGQFVAHWGSTGANALSSPAAVAVRGNSVYVADTGNHRVQRFTADGVHSGGWDGSGGGGGALQEPEGIALDEQGNVYVADAGNQRIQKFAPDGLFLASLGGEGTDEGRFTRPFGIAVAADGTVTVSDAPTHRVQQFTPAGASLLRVERGAPGGSGARARQPGTEKTRSRKKRNATQRSFSPSRGRRRDKRRGGGGPRPRSVESQRRGRR